MIKISKIMGVILLLGQLTVVSQAKWKQVGGSLNVDPKKRAILSNVVVNNSNLYVIWNESNTHTSWAESGGDWKNYVKHWDGKKWVQDGTCLNFESTINAGLPSLAIVDNTLYATWLNYPNQGNVNAFDGEHWISKKFIVSNTNNPALFNLNNQLYLCPNIKNGLYVDYLENGEWLAKGMQINKAKIYSTPTMAVAQDGTIYIAYFEHSIKYRLIVKKWFKDKWVALGNESIFISQNKPWSNPSMVVYNNQLYLAADNGGVVQIFKFLDNEWLNVGRASGVSPQLIEYNNTLVVSFCTNEGIVLSSLADDGAWRVNQYMINGFNQKLGILNNKIHVVYQKSNKDGIINIYVNEWDEIVIHYPIPVPTMIPVDPDYRV